MATEKQVPRKPQKATLSARRRHKEKILSYLSDPDNEFPTREFLAKKVCGIHRRTLYRAFTPDELRDIEKEALELRRTKYAAELSAADMALIKEAKTGDVSAIKLMYQKFEGWSEKQVREHTGAIEVTTGIRVVPVRSTTGEEEDD